MSENKENQSKDISRKDALKKMGTYAAFAALGTMIMPKPGFGGGNGARGVRRNKNKK